MRKTTLFIAMFIVSVAPSASARNVGNHIIEELRDEAATSSRPFSITRVEQLSGILRLFINTDGSAVANLLRSGRLAAQLSEGDSEKTVSLSLGKAVRCAGGTMYLGYYEQLPECNIESIEYFLSAPVVLRSGRDLAIGLDPDFLWLIEER